MALLDTWRNLAYQTEMDNKTANEFWGSYFTQEKAIYEQILADPDTVVKGTVKELADKYGVRVNITMMVLLLLLTIWLLVRQIGYMSFHSGITFLMKLQEKIYTRSRSYQELSLRARRLDVMIHVLAEAVRSTNSAVERTLNW